MSTPQFSLAKKRRIRLITDEDTSDDEREFLNNPEEPTYSEPSVVDPGANIPLRSHEMSDFRSTLANLRSFGIDERSTRRSSERNNLRSLPNSRRQSGSRVKVQCLSGQNSSNQPKRIEKPKSTVSSEILPSTLTSLSSKQSNDGEPDSDDFCWICHKVGQMVVCTYCPRVYHPACLHMAQFPETWLCPECQDLVIAECLVYQAPKWKQVTKPQLQRMLYFLLDRLSMQSWAEHFREPVDTTELVGYSDVVFYPMNLRTLYLRNKDGQYASPQSFLGDFRWILHNCIVFNGPSAPITSHARLLDRTCVRELTLMKACPTCYQNRMSALHLLPSTSHKLSPITGKEWLDPIEPTSTGEYRSSSASVTTLDERELDPWWFCQLCDDIHPLVWVRLQHYPRWPAKVIYADGDNMLVTFFGDYDLTMAPTASVKLHSESQATRSSTLSSTKTVDTAMATADGGADPDSSDLPESTRVGFSRPNFDPRTDANYQRAVAELDHHVALIKARYPKFKLPATSLVYTKRHVSRYYERLREVTAVSHIPVTSVNTSVSECVSLATESLTEPQPQQTTSSEIHGDSTDMASNDVVPLLSRVSSTLKQSFKGSTSFGTNILASTPVNCRPQGLVDSNTSVLPRTERTDHQESDTTPFGPPIQPMESDSFRSQLHPLPVSPDDPMNADDVRALLEKFRSQFNEALTDLESKWRSTKSTFTTIVDPPSNVSRGPPTLCAITLDKEVQTVPVQPTSDQTSRNSALDDVGSERLYSGNLLSTRPATTFQTAMMEAEIERLDQEVKRLNLLLAFTRAEQALESRNRILELRRVWNFEVSAILEAASKIWEQDVIRIVDAVKRKQWCAYCGRVAYYYCCWNTCYCNSVCQSKHWGLHINQCVQARTQSSGTSLSNDTTDSHLRMRKPSPVIPGQSN